MPTQQTLKRIATRIKHAEGIAHHEALDRAAQKYGYANWKHAFNAQKDSGDDSNSRLKSIMAAHPYLSAYGLGLANVVPREEQRAHFERSRVELAASGEAFKVVSHWLSNIEKIKSVNRHNTSYGLKHLVEKETGYITNGLFIAAALDAGFTMYLNDGPNPSFNMSQKSLRAARKRIDEMTANGFKPIHPCGRTKSV